jgi:carboxymethylenebutenolidase
MGRDAKLLLDRPAARKFDAGRLGGPVSEGPSPLNADAPEGQEQMMMRVEAALPRGTCPLHCFAAADAREMSTVLLFMDAFGPRPALFKIAEALAADGHRVVLPDLFYPHLPYRPLEPRSLFSGGEDRIRLHEMMADLDRPTVEADVAALVEFARGHWGEARPIGAVGYCLGGRYALAAATLSESVRYAASIHGSYLAPDTDDGLGERLARAKAKIYVAVAAQDPTFDAAEEGRLSASLRAAGLDHTLETYAGAAHGFAMDDLPVFDADAARRHLERVRSDLRASFAPEMRA